MVIIFFYAFHGTAKTDSRLKPEATNIPFTHIHSRTLHPLAPGTPSAVTEQKSTKLQHKNHACVAIVW